MCAKELKETDDEKGERSEVGKRERESTEKRKGWKGGGAVKGREKRKDGKMTLSNSTLRCGASFFQPLRSLDAAVRR